MDSNNERFTGISGALANKLSEGFELATGLEKEGREVVLFRESAHRIAADADCLRARVKRLQDDLVDKKSGSD